MWYVHPSSNSLRLFPMQVKQFKLNNVSFHRFKYLRLHSYAREGSCCWFSGCHSLPPLINRLFRDPERGRPAPIMPGTVSRRAVGPAGGLSWLQISGVINTITIKSLWWWWWSWWWWRCTGRSCPHLRAHSTATQWQCRFQHWIKYLNYISALDPPLETRRPMSLQEYNTIWSHTPQIACRAG